MCPRCPNVPSIVTVPVAKYAAVAEQSQQRYPTKNTPARTRIPFKKQCSVELFDYPTPSATQQKHESTLNNNHAECTRCHFVFCPECQRDYHASGPCQTDSEIHGSSNSGERPYKSYSWRQSKRNLRRLATLDK